MVNLTYKFSELHARIITGSILGMGAIGLFFLPHWLFTLMLFIILSIILCTEWPRFFSINDPRFWIIIPFYPIMPALFLLYLQVSGFELINLMTIALVGAHDTGSYLVGKRWGITPISPTISPRKTWEGFAGGLLFSSLFSLIFFWYTSWTLFLGSVLPFVAGLNGAALSGDLFESHLKRSAGIKDSGTLLPGHGGILDRIDGILFGVVFVFFLRNWLKPLLF